jgi:pseudouridine-5'-phosphate glycosidase
MNPYLDVRPEIAAALAAKKPVVALESTVIAHGLPRPHNLETAIHMEAAIRENGAVPATIGLLHGRLVVGLTREEIEVLANTDDIAKASRRDLSLLLSSHKPGATTVAATMFIAHLAGLRVFATGGIGGVHRGVEDSLDISADLTELARTPVAVVCAGAKIILDLPRTLELLETLGVPVVGYGTNEFPAFYVRESGCRVDARVDSPDQAARLMKLQWDLGLSAGIVFGNPPPPAVALPRAEAESLIEDALDAADTAGIQGKAVTPFLLAELSKHSGGRSLETNMSLLVENARLAALISRSFSALSS